jgi:hypothetical protein
MVRIHGRSLSYSPTKKGMVDRVWAIRCRKPFNPALGAHIFSFVLAPSFPSLVPRHFGSVESISYFCFRSVFTDSACLRFIIHFWTLGLLVPRFLDSTNAAECLLIMRIQTQVFAQATCIRSYPGRNLLSPPWNSLQLDVQLSNNFPNPVQRVPTCPP